MKIALVCNGYAPVARDGIRVFTRQAARHLRAAGHEVRIAGLAAQPEAYVDDGVPVTLLGQGSGWLLDRWQLRCWLQREVDAGRVDAIEVPDFSGALPFPLDGAGVCVRLHLTATSIHRRDGSGLKSQAAWCERRQLALHRHWIGVSRFAIDDTLAVFGLQPHAATVVYSPIAAEAAGHRDLRLPAPYLLYVGAVTGRKGAFTLAEALPMIRRSAPELTLVYVGSAPDVVREQVRSRAGGDGERILFTGVLPERADVLAAMRGCAAFVAPSAQEYLGAVAVEAMLQEAAVVVGDHGAAREFITPDTDGLLVPTGDPAALAAAVRRLRQDPAFARRLGQAAARRVQQQFSVAAFVDRTVTAYAAALTAARRRPRSSSFLRYDAE